MVRVRCPQCQTEFRVASAQPVCPGCGFAGQGAAAAATLDPRPSESWSGQAEGEAPATQWVRDPEPVAGAWSPDQDQEHLPAETGGQPASEAPKGSRTGVIAAVLVVTLLLVGGAAAYLVIWSPLSPFGKDNPPVTEDDLRAALDRLDSDLSDTAEEAWMFKVNGESDGEAMNMEMGYDPNGPKTHTRTVLAGDGGQGLDYTEKQVGRVINHIVDGTTYVGRDEDPTTYDAPTFNDDPSDPIGSGNAPALENDLFDEVEITSTTQEKLRGRDATRFDVVNRTDSQETGSIWIFHDDKRLGKMYMINATEEFTVDVFWGDDVDITVTETGTRTSFSKPESSLTFLGDDEETTYQYEIPDDFKEEVKLEEVELHAINGTVPSQHEFEDGSGSAEGDPVAVRARMLLTDGTKTEGNFTLAYEDRDADGLLSAGDVYTITVRNGDDFEEARFFDLWSGVYDGGPLPGFDWVLALAAVGSVLALGRRSLQRN